MARDVLLNANQTHVERDLQQGCQRKGYCPALYFPPLFIHFRSVGATLVDRVQLLATQEQKNNILEAQRKIQYDARMQSAKTALAGLLTLSAGSPVVFPALPTPPSSPDDLSMLKCNCLFFFLDLMMSYCIFLLSFVQPFHRAGEEEVETVCFDVSSSFSCAFLSLSSFYLSLPSPMTPRKHYVQISHK